MAEKRTYEVMYIVTPDTAEDDVTKLNENLQGVIEKEGGTIIRLDNMGRRKLAYEIKRQTEGYYVLFEIEGSGSEIAELERRMRVNDSIMRYLTVRVDEERKTAEKIRAKREKRRSNLQRGAFRNTETAVEDEILAVAAAPDNGIEKE